jgi:16S rRNA (guanine(966)-N(2))-methyltransferase RsmD
MRVISGKYRSRKLIAPPGLDTRPTSDRLRETLFNVVAPSVPGSVWLDLFAGTGAVGIEAFSRGAREVHFVESSARAARAIRENLASLGISTGFSLLEREASAALRLLEGRQVCCDFCFLDPPYAHTRDYEQVLSFLSMSALMKPGSLVIAEHDKRVDPGESFGRLSRLRKLRQGDAVLSFYRTPSAERATGDTNDAFGHADQ